MKILVCMKQVPQGTKLDIDPETGALKRQSGAVRTNPYDLFALETALTLRDHYGGTVTVLTMGPDQAASMMKDAFACGADDAVIRLRSLETFAKVADGQSTKILIPSDLQDMSGLLLSLKETAKD